MSRKILSLALSFMLLFSQTGFAQVAGQLNIAAYLGTLAPASIDKLRLPHLRYFSYDNLNNSFKLILDKGDSKEIKGAKLTDSAQELLKYFLIGITLPNESFWVNLRPDSPDNIIDDWLAQTDVGRILLEADLQLKKDTAEFTSPQTAEGKLYWDKLYQKAGELFGSENVNIPTLTRPWIVPGEVIIRESSDSAYIYKATLKVMLEQDHLANGKGQMANGADYSFNDPRLKALNEYSSQLIRQLIIPKLTKEVNISKRYANLRQVYYSIILARWFKSRFYGKGGVYSWAIDKRNLNGLTSEGQWSKTTYFKEYKSSFEKGQYNLQVPVAGQYGQNIRSYFSGGIQLGTAGSPAGVLCKTDIANYLKQPTFAEYRGAGNNAADLSQVQVVSSPGIRGTAGSPVGSAQTLGELFNRLEEYREGPLGDSDSASLESNWGKRDAPVILILNSWAQNPEYSSALTEYAKLHSAIDISRMSARDIITLLRNGMLQAKRVSLQVCFFLENTFAIARSVSIASVALYTGSSEEQVRAIVDELNSKADAAGRAQINIDKNGVIHSNNNASGGTRWDSLEEALRSKAIRKADLIGPRSIAATAGSPVKWAIAELSFKPVDDFKNIDAESISQIERLAREVVEQLLSQGVPSSRAAESDVKGMQVYYNCFIRELEGAPAPLVFFDLYYGSKYLGYVTIVLKEKTAIIDGGQAQSVGSPLDNWEVKVNLRQHILQLLGFAPLKFKQRISQLVGYAPEDQENKKLTDAIRREVLGLLDHPHGPSRSGYLTKFRGSAIGYDSYLIWKEGKPNLGFSLIHSDKTVDITSYLTIRPKSASSPVGQKRPSPKGAKRSQDVSWLDRWPVHDDGHGQQILYPPTYIAQVRVFAGIVRNTELPLETRKAVFNALLTYDSPIDDPDFILILGKLLPVLIQDPSFQDEVTDAIKRLRNNVFSGIQEAVDIVKKEAMRGNLEAIRLLTKVVEYNVIGFNFPRHPDTLNAPVISAFLGLEPSFRVFQSFQDEQLKAAAAEALKTLDILNSRLAGSSPSKKPAAGSPVAHPKALDFRKWRFSGESIKIQWRSNGKERVNYGKVRLIADTDRGFKVWLWYSSYGIPSDAIEEAGPISGQENGRTGTVPNTAGSPVKVTQVEITEMNWKKPPLLDAASEKLQRVLREELEGLTIANLNEFHCPLVLSSNGVVSLFYQLDIIGGVITVSNVLQKNGSEPMDIVAQPQITLTLQDGTGTKILSSSRPSGSEGVPSTPMKSGQVREAGSPVAEENGEREEIQQQAWKEFDGLRLLGWVADKELSKEVVPELVNSAMPLLAKMSSRDFAQAVQELRAQSYNFRQLLTSGFLKWAAEHLEEFNLLTEGERLERISTIRGLVRSRDGAAGSPVSIKKVERSVRLTPEELRYQDSVWPLIANELPKKLSTGPERKEGDGELLGKATGETEEGNTLPEREVYFMLCLAMTSTYLVYFQEPGRMILLATVYMANPPAVGSSPLQQNAVGGIDFRNIPMIVQPIGNFSSLKFNAPSSPVLQKMNLDEEFKEISSMVDKGILPSSQRVKEFIFACCYKKELSQRLADLIPLLTSLCRLQEECVCEAEPELKESLMLVEAVGASAATQVK